MRLLKARPDGVIFFFLSKRSDTIPMNKHYDTKFIFFVYVCVLPNYCLYLVMHHYMGHWTQFPSMLSGYN